MPARLRGRSWPLPHGGCVAACSVASSSIVLPLTRCGVGATFLILASPSAESMRMYIQPKSNSYYLLDSLAEVAYAWWLL
jgi:hypothetical protein